MEYLNYEKCRKITEDGYVPKNAIGTIMTPDGSTEDGQYLFTNDEVWAVTQEDWDNFYAGKSCEGCYEFDAEYEDEEKNEEVVDEEPVESELDMWKRVAGENNNKYLVALADLQNVRKRTISEKEALKKYKDEDFGKDLLEIIDNFERALKAFVVKDETNEANKQGVELIYNQLLKVFNKHEIVPIEINEHDMFNEDTMNATGAISVPSFNEHEVINVTQKGYKLKDKVIRFANVIVAN